MARKRLAMAVVAFGVVAAACSGGGAGGGAPQSEGDGAASTTGLAREADAAPGAEPGGLGSAPAGAAALPPLGPSVIKTAELELQVPRDGLDEAVSEVTTVAAAAGGFLLSSTTAEGGGGVATLVVRVPSARFERTLGRIRGVGEVRTEHVSGEEVGQEFVDLEARLRNFAAQQAVLLRLMDQAATITDTIRVQNELQGVQLEIERIRGRLRYLRDQTALGTVTVRLTEEGVAAAGRFAKAWDRAVELFQGVVSALIVAGGVVVPFGLMAAAGLVGYRRLRPRFGGS
ncbi:MAG TPA: DUF4349 domain-containing protein [Actinomycetota bacterium]|nr:DUF4349 domain-containing protein [Actinomycetota bacterium]